MKRSHFEQRALWKEAAASLSSRETALRFGALWQEYCFGSADPQLYGVMAALEQPLMTVEVLRRIHILSTSYTEILLREEPFPGEFKEQENGGCPVEDTHGLTAEFVSAVNGMGRGNPLFYTAYLMMDLMRLAPFASGNEQAAMAAANFYLVSRGLPPLLFLKEREQDTYDILRRTACNQELSELKTLLDELAQDGSELLFSGKDVFGTNAGS